jgi:hypothetical protein
MKAYRVYGVDTEDTDIDYINCSDEQFMNVSETHGLIWEDISEFVRQLNEGEINPSIIQFRTIKYESI